MDKFPRAVFASERARNPQNERGDVLSSADLCLPALDLKNRRKVGSLILGYGLEARYRTIPEAR